MPHQRLWRPHHQQAHTTRRNAVSQASSSNTHGTQLAGRQQALWTALTHTLRVACPRGATANAAGVHRLAALPFGADLPGAARAHSACRRCLHTAAAADVVCSWCGGVGGRSRRRRWRWARLFLAFYHNMPSIERLALHRAHCCAAAGLGTHRAGARAVGGTLQEEEVSRDVRATAGLAYRSSATASWQLAGDRAWAIAAPIAVCACRAHLASPNRRLRMRRLSVHALKGHATHSSSDSDKGSGKHSKPGKTTNCNDSTALHLLCSFHE